MPGEKFSAVLLQPHDTPLSQMLSQHRRILGRLAQAGSLLFPEHLVCPLHPSHCLVRSPLEIQRLKKEIRGCTIMPPVLSQGFLLRPVELEGGSPDSAAAVALQAVLPFFLREPGCRGEAPKTPGGFAFGCIRGRHDGKAVNRMDGTAENEINRMMDDFAIEPLQLRVFRLHSVEYRWDRGEIPGPASALTWTLAPPQWVRLHR